MYHQKRKNLGIRNRNCTDSKENPEGTLRFAKALTEEMKWQKNFTHPDI